LSTSTKSAFYIRASGEASRLSPQGLRPRVEPDRTQSGAPLPMGLRLHPKTARGSSIG